MFLSKKCIEYVMSAPFHPATNGLAEQAVQIVKKGERKKEELWQVDLLKC